MIYAGCKNAWHTLAEGSSGIQPKSAAWGCMKDGIVGYKIRLLPDLLTAYMVGCSETVDVVESVVNLRQHV